MLCRPRGRVGIAFAGGGTRALIEVVPISDALEYSDGSLR